MLLRKIIIMHMRKSEYSTILMPIYDSAEAEASGDQPLYMLTSRLTLMATLRESIALYSHSVCLYDLARGHQEQQEIKSFSRQDKSVCR